jgi:glutamyl-tRNA synthetase
LGLQEWDKLWTFNKKVIDPVCPRHTGVVIHARVLLKLTDVEGPDYVSLDRHKKYPAAGKKTTMRSGVRPNKFIAPS